MENFEADKIKISDILDKRDIRYEIPLYQREYSWEKDYIENFWEYLVDEDDNYFLWTIVFSVEGRDNIKEVVDWQQRLITITIFLSIVRKIFFELEDTNKWFAIHQNYIASIDRDNEDIWYKLVVWTKLRNFFEKYIQKKGWDISNSLPESKEEKRVKNNFISLNNKVISYLWDWNVDSKVKKLQNLRDKVLGLELVYIQVMSQEDAYTFFETINATWMKLSTADVLKNLLFKETKSSIDDVNKIWDQIIRNLSSWDEAYNVTQFIRYFWLSKHKKVTDKKLYNSIKRSVKSKDIKEKKYLSYDDLIDDLNYYSKLYSEIINPIENNYKWIFKSLYNFLKNISHLNVTQPYPTILAILDLTKRKNFEKLSTVKLLDLINTIEKFTFVYKLSWKSPSPLEWLFSEIWIKITKIKNKKELEKVIDQSIVDIKNKMPEKEEYLIWIKNKLVYRNKDLIKYFFDKLYNSTNELKFEHINIEHIFPQNPSSWNKMVDELLHSIWNLTILWPSINRKASNKLPLEKFDDLKSSEIQKNKELADYIKKNWWTDSDIELRVSELSEESWKIFKL